MRFCRVDKLSNCVSRSFTIEFAKFVAPLRLPLRKLAYDMFQALFPVVERKSFSNFLALRFLAVPTRPQEWAYRRALGRVGETHWGAKNDDFLHRCLFMQGRGRPPPARDWRSLIDGAALCLVIFAVEYCR